MATTRSRTAKKGRKGDATIVMSEVLLDSDRQTGDYELPNTASQSSPDLYARLDEKRDMSDIPNSSSSHIQIRNYTFNRVVVITHVNIFLYSCCFWIQNAVFPYLSKQLGADPVMFGYLQTTFAIVQLAGGPLFGRFGDLFGSRRAMMLAFIAAASSYFLLFISSNMLLLFLSRLPSVFMHAMQGGQMIVTDVSTPRERASALGKLGLSYGVGMVVGPLIGGFISKFFSLETGALVACLGSLLSVCLIYTLVPARVKKVQVTGPKDSVFNIRKIGHLLAAPRALFLLLVKMGTGIPIGIFQSMFAVIALEIFKLPPEQNSAIMSYIGFMGMLVQGMGVGFVTKAFSEQTILTVSAATLAISYLLLAQVTSIFQLCVVFIPLVCGLTFQNVITTSALTHTVPDSDTGAMLGLSMAVNSLIRSISPTAGGYMLNKLGFPSFGYLGCIMCLIVTLVLCIKGRRTE